ncbi:type IV toxin-antitoxin system AbiEi family antitoxin [Leadbettera azotonutricia]|uniref:Transcriptional regulator, AbiEi antitoxin, Type IV TA system n=1 Tax=Leadbettera azotonutricia (strain ATCC BAA-888 / DSM 13862 / ZAS-9) TaxID=545695 RepID=F5YB27_LEAAZ|nr:hypothetical protein [Leadbettera azotonutricia]AEF81160.1 conserved hypothetical protein [Leadbettera azotonutricia ZAS-9]
MQAIQKLRKTLETLADGEHYLFSVSDFYPLFPGMSEEALRVLLGRAVKAELLQRICRGMYVYPKAGHPRGFELYHAASRLREDTFCYLSLESVLSEAGIISQIPLGWITLMTGGRSGIIHCGKQGSIEFIHTKKSFDGVSSRLFYDPRYRLWRASADLALEDMRAAKRSLDLVDWGAVSE